jgi:hypothetical protein
MILIVAELFHRGCGDYTAAAARYPDVLACLTCGRPVDPARPHVYARDAAYEAADVDDPEAMLAGIVGLLHPDPCTQRYLDAAARQGIGHLHAGD